MRLIDLDKLDWETFPCEFANYAEAGSVKKWLDEQRTMIGFMITDSTTPATVSMAKEAVAALQIFVQRYLDCCMASVKERKDKDKK